MLLFACRFLPSRFFRTLPKTVLPADQVAPQPQDINGYPSPLCPKIPATPVHYPLCQCYSQNFTSLSAILPAPKIHGQLPSNNPPLKILSPLIPPSPTPPAFTSSPNSFITPYPPTINTLIPPLLSYPIYLMLLILYLMFVIPLIYVSFNKLNYQPC